MRIALRRSATWPTESGRVEGARRRGTTAAGWCRDDKREGWYPHGESNLDLGLRRALLYPLSYGGAVRRRGGKWYARRDSNARPLAPEANALSS